MILPLRRYADFRGRSRRAEFWWWTLAYILVTVALIAVMFSGFPWDAVGSDGQDVPLPDPEDGPFAVFGVGTWIGGVLYFLFWAGTIVTSLAVTVRRLHDRGISGWWYGGLLIANFIPLVNILTVFGFIALLVICAFPGQKGPNRWGPDPKDPSEAYVFE